MSMPIINWTNPLTRKLTFAHPCWDFRQAYPASTVISNASGSTDPSRAGRWLEFDRATSESLVFTKEAGEFTAGGLGDFTVAFRAYVIDGALNGNTVISIGNTGIARRIEVGQKSAASNTWRFGNFATTTETLSTSNALIYGQWTTVVCRRSDGVGTLWVDGVDKTASDSTGSFDFNNTYEDLTLGGSASGGQSFNGSVAFAYVWDRGLGDGEIVSLTSKPWQVFKPRRYFVPLIDEPIIDVPGEVTGETVTITLVDALGTTLNNLTNISWAWFDEATPDTANTPTAQGTGETTDGSGVLQIDITGTTLTTGGTGMLALMDSTGYIYALYRVTL